MSDIRELFESGRATLGTRVVSPWPGVVEALGQSGPYDYVEFLAEYAPHDLYDLEHITRTADLVDLDAIIKIDEENRAYLAQRAVAAGFDGLLFSSVRSAADVRECIRAVRTEPDGDNGVRMDRRRGYVGSYTTTADIVREIDETVIGIMIEKAAAVESLDEILSVPGVDFVQFGPVDYAVSIDEPDTVHSGAVKEVEREVIKAAIDHGVRPRAEISESTEVAPYRDLGVVDFNLGTDLTILQEEWSRRGTDLRDQLD